MLITGSDGEIGANLAEGALDVVNVFGLGVQRVVVHILIIYAVFFSASNANFLHFLSVTASLLDYLVHLPSPAIVSWALLSSSIWQSFGYSNRPPLPTNRSCG